MGKLDELKGLPRRSLFGGEGGSSRAKPAPVTRKEIVDRISVEREDPTDEIVAPLVGATKRVASGGGAKSHCIGVWVGDDLLAWIDETRGGKTRPHRVREVLEKDRDG